MIVLDTTVLVYAAGQQHRFREPCRRLLAAVADEAVVATTTVEAIQEFTHVRSRRRDRSEAVGLATDYIDLLGPLLTVEEADLLAGLRTFETYPAVGCFDAVLAAAARAAGGTLVSTDIAFSAIPGLHHVVPDEDGVRALLARAGE